MGTSRLNYRAYHPYYEEIYEVKAIHLLEEFVVLKMPHYLLNKYSFKDVELMQSKGVVDKDGLETFDGDVIEFTPMADKISKRHIVRPSDSLFEDAIFTNDQFIRFLNGYEILGNIYDYENDELIK